MAVSGEGSFESYLDHSSGARLSEAHEDADTRLQSGLSGKESLCINCSFMGPIKVLYLQTADQSVGKVVLGNVGPSATAKCFFFLFFSSPSIGGHHMASLRQPTTHPMLRVDSPLSCQNMQNSLESRASSGSRLFKVGGSGVRFRTDKVWTSPNRSASVAQKIPSCRTSSSPRWSTRSLRDSVRQVEARRQRGFFSVGSHGPLKEMPLSAFRLMNTSKESRI